MGMEQQEEVASLLVGDALAIIDERYGPGGQKPLGYHNPNHTRGVVTATDAIAQLAIMNRRFNPSSMPASRVASGFHDVRQGLGTGINEGESIVEMHEAVERRGKRGPTLSDYLVELAAQYMAATVVFLDEDGVLRQSPIGNDYGELIMADADLFSLGAPEETYWTQAQGLFNELYGFEADRETQAKFLKNSQAPLLECHLFYTPEAATLFPHQAKNLSSTIKVLDLLQQGDERYENLMYVPFSVAPELFIASSD